MLQLRVESHLLAALDAESDAQIADQLRTALAVLLSAGASGAPGYWLRLLSGVALAAAAAGGAAAGAAAAGGAAGILDDRGDQEDDEEPAAAAAAAPAAPPPATAAAAASVVPLGGSGMPPPPAMATPRLRTRLFAADLLLAMFAAVGADPRHRVPPPKHDDDESGDAAGHPSNRPASAFGSAPLPRSPAPASPTPSSAAAAITHASSSASDWLVDHLQALIDAGFKLTTGGAEALRPAGARLLRRTVRWFAGVADPDVPEALLLEQYQAQVCGRLVWVWEVARLVGGRCFGWVGLRSPGTVKTLLTSSYPHRAPQFVSALRAALRPGSPPALSVAGGALATAFIGAGLAANDGAVMHRLLGLLVAPLACWRQLAFPQFAEVVSVLARVALLQAHAQCANIAAASSSSGSGNGSSSAAPAAAVGELCAGMVAKAQAPHGGMLRVLWGALLQDLAVLSTQSAAVAAHYRSILFGDVTPAVADGVTPCYEAAWPAVLAALAAQLPPAAAITEARVHQEAGAAAAAAPGAAREGWSEFVDVVSASDGAAANAGAWEEQAAARAWTVYSFLTDYSLVLISDHGGQTADAFASGAPPRECLAAAQRTAAALAALRALLGPAHLAAGLAPPAVCKAAAQIVTALSYDTLYPMAWLATDLRRSARPSSGVGSSSSGSSVAAAVGLVAEAAAGVLRALCQGLPAAAWADDAELAPAVVESLLALTSVAAPYSLDLTVDRSKQAAAPYAPVAPGRAAAAAASGPQLARALADALAAARQLLAARPAPAGALRPLFEMGVRLLLSAPPGPQVAAAQAFFCDSCLPAAVAAGDKESAGLVNAASAALIGSVGQAVNAASGGGGGGGGSARLPALLTALLGSAATLSVLSGGADLVAAALGVVQSALVPGAPPAAQRAALEALRATLQEAQAEHQQQQKGGRSTGKAALAERCMGALAPQVAALVHAGTRRPAAALEGERLAAVVEGLKVLLLVNNLSAAKGEPAQAAVLSVLVPLLVEAAAPEGAAAPTPALRDMALKLLTAMPAAPSGGAAFRAAVAALPAGSKARLQAALRGPGGAAGAGAGAAGCAGARGGAGVQAPAKPAIQLKTTFALPNS